MDEYLRGFVIPIDLGTDIPGRYTLLIPELYTLNKDDIMTSYLQQFLISVDDWSIVGESNYVNYEEDIKLTLISFNKREELWASKMLSNYKESLRDKYIEKYNIISEFMYKIELEGMLDAEQGGI